MEKNKKFKFLVIFVVIIIFSYSLYYFNTKNVHNNQGSNNRTIIDITNDPFIGNINANIIIVEFSDFQCPYCGRFYKEVFPKIYEDYIEPGKAKFVYKNFPLSIHQYSKVAAEAGLCANEQEKFWDYGDKLFNNQNVLDINSLKKYASDIGLDTKKFNECLDFGKMSSEVQKDINEAVSYNVKGTPTIFINGIKLVGVQPIDSYIKIIEDELNE
ncbi:MAG: DsbA family protein [Nanoarchaeota archaeon]|nr:DsbA family protein [Nanoarchaeota archaeon]